MTAGCLRQPTNGLSNTEKPMSMKTCTSKESAGTTHADTPDLDAPVFGVDQDGNLHRYDAGSIVATTLNGDLEHHEPDVGRDTVDHWISYVGRERGWIDVWWNAQGTDTVARLASALDAARQETLS